MIELNNYSEIKEKTEKAYKLAKYLYSQDNKMDEPIFLDVKDMISLISVHCNTDKSLDKIEILKADIFSQEVKKINSSSNYNL